MCGCINQARTIVLLVHANRVLDYLGIASSIRENAIKVVNESEAVTAQRKAVGVSAELQQHHKLGEV